MEKLDFISENVIHCVHNEPALWDTACSDVYPEIVHVGLSTLMTVVTVSP